MRATKLLATCVTVFLAAGLAGCGPTMTPGARNFPSAQRAELTVPTSVPSRGLGGHAVQIASVNIDGASYLLSNSTETFALAPGRHTITVTYADTRIFNRSSLDYADRKIEFSAQEGQKYWLVVRLAEGSSTMVHQIIGAGGQSVASGQLVEPPPVMQP